MSAQAILDKMNAVNALETDDKSQGRTKAANQWVAHYIAVAKLKEQFLEENPGQKFTAKVAEELLINSWEVKEIAKEEEEI